MATNESQVTDNLCDACEVFVLIRFEKLQLSYVVLFTFRTIPPEQQAEADELAAALSELQTITRNEIQEVVGDLDTLSK